MKVLGISLSPLSLILLWLEAPVEYVTLTDTEQDSELRRDRHEPGCPVSVFCLLLCSDVSLALQTSIKQLLCDPVLESGW